MGIIRRLTEKPWLSAGLDASGQLETAPALSSAAVGLRLYFAVASVMFLLLAVMLVMRMGGHGISTGQQPDWKPMVWPPLLAFNTTVLTLSSAAWEWARLSGRGGDGANMRTGLLAGGVLALVFVAGQLIVWRQLQAAGCGITATTMSAFFYLITALHGIHVVGGLAVWGRTSLKVLGGAAPAQVVQSVDLCASYWHFLLVVWLVMLGVLLAT